MPSQEWTLMGKLVSQIYSRADAEPFREPVDWKTLGLFDYPQLIKKPMDLGQIKKKIEKEQYTTLHDAAEDVRLVWKNCMQYNADGSDFFKLADSLKKRFEDRYAKLLKELNIPPQTGGSGGTGGSGSGSSSGRGAAPVPTLDEKRTFAKNLYKISKEELGKVIVDLDAGCPEAITKNSAEDQVEINVDNITPESFQSVNTYVSKCVSDASGRKKKSTGGNKTKKARTS
eukprot:CAMPEP_0203673614 /NCGR_PEP_ID=MMETSP0090-20130426/13246_1 /ASSEMBLY_ACC=CAM_ASM_001088 /TAXON_ID=426623 /ORGANISM="Chaetoceros affinis, Strain CCMP159" /LENGTH=228 /DNA_ID=CAMNT_0050539309 /DNA_START=99 /DNA_END=788 /DNA_ORIENTATION=+